MKQSHITIFESAKERISKECKDHPQLILSAIEIKSHEGDVVTIACEDWITEEKQGALGEELKKAKQIIKEEFEAKELVFQILKDTPETILENKNQLKQTKQINKR